MISVSIRFKSIKTIQSPFSNVSRLSSCVRVGLNIPLNSFQTNRLNSTYQKKKRTLLKKLVSIQKYEIKLNQIYSKYSFIILMYWPLLTHWRRAQQTIEFIEKQRRQIKIRNMNFVEKNHHWPTKLTLIRL